MTTLERCYSKMYNISRDIKEGNSDISSDEMRRGLVSVFSLCRKYIAISNMFVIASKPKGIRLYCMNE